MSKDKKLWIDCVAGSELRDSQGETLSVEGADITELEAGKGRWNDNHGKGFWNSLGRVTEAKKIFKVEDCENDRHKYYWEKIKAPYIYATGYLYNDEDHSNAKAAAAILRNVHKSDCPLKVKSSVEGGVVSRGIKDSTRLERTKIHSIALTFTPANKATLVEPLNLNKSIDSFQEKIDQELIKSVIHLAKKDEEIPSFRHVQRNAQANRIITNIEKIQELASATGINIKIEETDTDTLIKNAIQNKVLGNVQKINDLMKQFNARKLFGEVQTKRQNIHSGLSKLPAAVSEPEVKQPKTNLDIAKPNAPMSSRLRAPSGDITADKDPADKQTAVPVQNAKQVKHDNTFKIHANRALKDDKYIDTLRQKLTDKKINPDRVNAIMDKVSSHMMKNEDMEKGKKLKNLAAQTALAGTLLLGTHAISQHQEQKKQLNIAEQKIVQAKKLKEDTKKKGVQQQAAQTIATKWENNTPKRLPASKVNKALTAGCGGSGSPMDLTGGGVLQPESKKKKMKNINKEEGFQYVTCNDCGEEQIYASHQVKCRKCSKSFSLKKLYDVMS